MQEGKEAHQKDFLEASDRIDVKSAKKPKSRPRSQYKRFFKELAEREQIVDRETYEAHEALTSEFNDIEEEIHLLRHCRNEKQDALGEARK
jgi:hypothetical protein